MKQEHFQRTSLGFWKPYNTALKSLEMCDFQTTAFIKSCQVPLLPLKCLLPEHVLQNAFRLTCHYRFTSLTIIAKGDVIYQLQHWDLRKEDLALHFLYFILLERSEKLFLLIIQYAICFLLYLIRELTELFSQKETEAVKNCLYK